MPAVLSMPPAKFAVATIIEWKSVCIYNETTRNELKTIQDMLHIHRHLCRHVCCSN